MATLMSVNKCNNFGKTFSNVFLYETFFEAYDMPSGFVRCIIEPLISLYGFG